MEPYRVEFTPLASAIAQTRYSLESVEAQVRADIDAMADMSGKRSVHGLVCMMVSMDGDISDEEEEPEAEDGKTYFFCDSVEEGVLRVDLGEFEDAGEMMEGPFKGRTVMMPRAMSRESITLDDLLGDELIGGTE